MQDRTYTGDLVQHKYSSVNYKIKKIVKLEKDKHIIIENNHEPIISKEDFKKVQQMLQEKANECKRNTKTEHILTGITFCKKCGARITYTKNHGTNFKIICSNYKKNGKKACDNIYLDEEKIINIIKQKILEQIKKRNLEQIKIEINSKDIDKIDKLNKEQEKNIKTIKQIYLDISNQEIDKLIGKQIIFEYTKENEMIEKRILELRNKANEKQVNLIKTIKGLEANETRNLLFTLINKIEISKNQLVIHYNFNNKI